MTSAVKLGASALVLAVEAAVNGWQRSSMRRLLHPTASGWRDLILFALSNSGLMPLLTIAFSFGLVALGAKMARIAVDLSPYRVSTGWPLVDIAAFLFVYSGVEYWEHALMHTPRFWPLHRLHHSAEEFNVITAQRHHPANYAVEVYTFGLIGAFATTPLWFAVLWACVQPIQQAVLHMDVAWTYGWFGRWVWVSPMHHRLHHSALPEHQGRNLSNSFILWDRLCGTYGEPEGNPPLGLGEDTEQGLLVECVEDSLTFLAGR